MPQKTPAVDRISLFLSELLGTALLVFLICGGCVAWGQPSNNLQTSLTSGISVLIIVQIFGCVSGAHINPAVTVAAVVYDLISAKMGCLYVLAQVLGAFMGYGLLIIVTPDNILHPPNSTGAAVGATIPHPDLTVSQAFAVEFVATAVLISFCCAVWDPRNEKFGDSVSIRFGLAIAGLALVAGPFTGASMNPARSFGPAIWSGDFYLHWIYWMAPLSAALVTSIVYKNVFRREVIESERVEEFKLKFNDDLILKQIA